MDAHEAARVKLDGAEYLFSSLLDDLASVMGNAPSNWTPERITLRAPPAAGHGMRAVAA